MALPLIYPDWPAPKNVRALSTTRQGGCSNGPWKSLNLGLNTGDDPDSVALNRERLNRSLPEEPVWLKQEHGSLVTNLVNTAMEPVADAAVSRQSGRVCAVLTADCLPLLICDRSGQEVAAIHCGWRGLAAGIIESCVNTLDSAPAQLLAWMGPAIGPQHYEVGMDVFDAFTGVSAEAGGAFTPGQPGRWQLDLYALVRIKLASVGITAVYGGGFSTFGEHGRFFSYRRDGETGRQASLIWLD